MQTTLATTLRSEYEARYGRNKAYSLRSFARDLDLSSGRLCDILNKESAVSEKTLQILADKLSFSEPLRQLLSEQEDKKRRGVADLKLIEIGNHIHVSAKHLALLSSISSEYSALSDLSYYEGNKDIVDAIAYELYDLEMIDLQLTDNNIFVKKVAPDLGKLIFDENSRKEYFKDCFKSSYESLDSCEIGKRIHSSSVLPIEHSDLAELQDYIGEFRAKLIQKANAKNTDSTEVRPYLLALSLTPVFE